MPKINRWVFVFFLAVLWPSVSRVGAAEPSPDASSSPMIVSSAAGEATSGVDSAVQTAQQEVRDPFAVDPEAEAPAIASVAAGSELAVVLQGIGFGSKDAYAVIGGEVFYTGDEKKGIKLLEVRKREVDILVSGGKVTVPLFPDQDLKKARDRAEKKSAKKSASADQPSEMSSP